MAYCCDELAISLLELSTTTASTTEKNWPHCSTYVILALLCQCSDVLTYIPHCFTQALLSLTKLTFHVPLNKN